MVDKVETCVAEDNAASCLLVSSCMWRCTSTVC